MGPWRRLRRAVAWVLVYVAFVVATLLLVASAAQLAQGYGR